MNSLENTFSIRMNFGEETATFTTMKFVGITLQSWLLFDSISNINMLLPQIIAMLSIIVCNIIVYVYGLRRHCRKFLNIFI